MFGNLDGIGTVSNEHSHIFAQSSQIGNQSINKCCSCLVGPSLRYR
jgi:hypothetical protein